MTAQTDSLEPADLARGRAREFQIVGLVSVAHFLSHVYMLVLPPFFPLLRDEFQVGYVDLGLMFTAFAVTAGVLQTPVGFLVNKIGGCKVLVAGLFINAGAVALMGFATSYWQMCALMLLAGAGSSVFHPADYSILAARVNNARLGRAMSAHTLGGNLGSVVTPLAMVAIAAFVGWRWALISVGAAGVLLALLLYAMSSIIGDDGKARRKEGDSFRRLITSPAIVSLFLFYALSSAANAGVVYFSVAAFGEIYGLPVAAASVALTVYQVLSLLAVLPGGWLADRVRNHEMLLCVSFAVSGALIVIGGIGLLPFWLAVVFVGASGALRGLVNSARDVSVRHAATDVSVGTLFAFVTTGYSGGQIIGPAVYGWLLDYGHPTWVFWASAVFSMLAIATMGASVLFRRAKAG